MAAERARGREGKIPSIIVATQTGTSASSASASASANTCIIARSTSTSITASSTSITAKQQHDRTAAPTFLDVGSSNPVKLSHKW